MRPVDHLLSVDPGAHSAWVLWERAGESPTWSPRRVGREAAPTALECRRLLGQLLPDWGRAALVVEGQFFSGKAGHSPWHAVEKLVEARCRWQHAAELCGAADVTVVRGSEWIPKLTRGAPGEDSKARIRFVVEHLLPGVPLRADEWDAAGLGCWWVREHGGRVAR